MLFVSPGSETQNREWNIALRLPTFSRRVRQKTRRLETHCQQQTQTGDWVIRPAKLGTSCSHLIDPVPMLIGNNVPVHLLDL